MIRNYIKVIYRNLTRHKVHSLINITGLAISIACCLLIFLFVKDEWTFDEFHSRADRIYRAWVFEDYGDNEQFFNSSTPFPLGPVLHENFSEIEHQVRITNLNSQVRVDDKTFTERVTVAGQHIFDVFDFNILEGDKDVLKDLQDVVLTRKYALKYFGDRLAVGQPLQISVGGEYREYTVRGVCEDPPSNSSIQFDILISDLNFPLFVSDRLLNSGWFNVNPETYLLLREQADAGDLESGFPKLFDNILGPDFEGEYKVGLQPLTDIHLNTDIPEGIAAVSNPRYSNILLGIAILILAIASINFVTLSIGRSLKRAQEVGIRKAAGASRLQLIFQFIGEAVAIVTLSLLLGFILAILFLPAFNDLSGKALVIDFNIYILMVSSGLILVIGVLAGSYPALVLSSFKPASVLKGSYSGGNSKQTLRKVLVGIQLILSVFLIASTLVMQKQLEFLRNKDLGFDEDQLVVVPLNVQGANRLSELINAGMSKADLLKQELLKYPEIISACASSHDFGTGGWTNIGYTSDKGTYLTFNANVVDEDYVPALQIEILDGRNFDNDNPSDKRRSIIINEAFARAYGWSDPVGQRIPGSNFPDHEVIGVVRDFHYFSLYTEVEPLVLVMDLSILNPGIENIHIGSSPVPKLMVRLAGDNIRDGLDHIQRSWEKITQGEEFVFSFVDESLDTQYSQDQHLGKIIGIATLLAILIGSLGLYGLASLTLQNRIKEISIRKVFGASVGRLLVFLTREYLILVGLSLIISIPLTIYFMQEWLESFEYKVTIGWQIFIFTGIIAAIIALITVSYETIKAASAKPVDTLKYE